MGILLSLYHQQKETVSSVGRPWLFKRLKSHIKHLENTNYIYIYIFMSRLSIAQQTSLA